MGKHGLIKLKLPKRLAASILKCGKRKVWLDPAEAETIMTGTSRAEVRKLIKSNLIVKKPQVIHSRARVAKRNIAKMKGRHTGIGKRKGTKEARMPSKVLWMRRIRVLRRLLKKYRAAGKIDKHLYHDLYQQSSGNKFKTKRNLMETIFLLKAERVKEDQIRQQAEARKAQMQTQKESRLAKEIESEKEKKKAQETKKEPEKKEPAASSAKPAAADKDAGKKSKKGGKEGKQ